MRRTLPIGQADRLGRGAEEFSVIPSSAVVWILSLDPKKPDRARDLGWQLVPRHDFHTLYLPLAATYVVKG
jgi:hypothetical protein